MSSLAAKLELLPHVPDKRARSDKVDRRVQNVRLGHLRVVKLLEIEHEMADEDRSQAGMCQYACSLKYTRRAPTRTPRQIQDS